MTSTQSVWHISLTVNCYWPTWTVTKFNLLHNAQVPPSFGSASLNKAFDVVRKHMSNQGPDILFISLRSEINEPFHFIEWRCKRGGDERLWGVTSDSAGVLVILYRLVSCHVLSSHWDAGTRVHTQTHSHAHTNIACDTTFIHLEFYSCRHIVTDYILL